VIPHDIHLEIGSLLFEGVDQIDLGLSRYCPGFRTRPIAFYGKTTASVSDVRGLRLAPDATLAEAPPFETTQRGQSNSTWRMHQSQPSIAAPPKTAPAAIIKEAQQSVRNTTAKR
jgi:hypothetical protein